MTTQAMPISMAGPSASTVAALIDAPSRTTANSSSNFALKLIPGFHAGPGVHKVRTSTPSRIASTRASR